MAKALAPGHERAAHLQALEAKFGSLACVQHPAIELAHTLAITPFPGGYGFGYDCQVTARQADVQLVSQPVRRYSFSSYLRRFYGGFEPF